MVAEKSLFQVIILYCKLGLPPMKFPKCRKRYELFRYVKLCFTPSAFIIRGIDFSDSDRKRGGGGDQCYGQPDEFYFDDF